jgi:hypothetical protein
MAGLDVALSLGLPVRVEVTETPHNGAEIAPLRALLAAKGIRGRTLRCDRWSSGVLHPAEFDRVSTNGMVAMAGSATTPQ